MARTQHKYLYLDNNWSLPGTQSHGSYDERIPNNSTNIWLQTMHVLKQVNSNATGYPIEERA